MKLLCTDATETVLGDPETSLFNVSSSQILTAPSHYPWDACNWPLDGLTTINHFIRPEQPPLLPSDENQPVTEPVNISFWPWIFVFFRFASPMKPIEKTVTPSLLTLSRRELTILWNRLTSVLHLQLNLSSSFVRPLLAETPPEAQILQSFIFFFRFSSTFQS